MKNPAVKKAAERDIENICHSFFGEPSFSGAKSLRYGRNGSLCVDIAGETSGCFYDYENGSGGDVVDLLARKLGSLSEALQWIEERYGHVPINDLPKPILHEPKKKRWSALAQSLWDKTTELKGTAGERYLQSRRLHDPKSPDIRFIDDWKGCPALCCKITDIENNEPISLQFFWVDDSGQKAFPFGDKRNKDFLPKHETKGGCIRTTDDADVLLGLGVAEGLEDALSAQEFAGLTTWSILNAGNLKSNIPPLAGIEEITVFADADDAGKSAAQGFTERMSGSGLIVSTQFPKQPHKDMNSWLMSL